ncbi:uncharacterized protein BYT42DRAFT_548494 [Radiomyces spectabilis]|uniref:uncharacterized protein n=1 Tax=Radiomyces spectabilis TaxID=64574 RepID=UPI0022202080|nr:uncharacterized protein BYT42DRAFT_548494 [Radiomyces spectabilis]KAI8371667.1 hypothetical protein BYT42DRAFT_548494 [Radiomyces spectabilis]
MEESRFQQGGDEQESFFGGNDHQAEEEAVYVNDPMQINSEDELVDWVDVDRQDKLVEWIGCEEGSIQNSVLTSLKTTDRNDKRAINNDIGAEIAASTTDFSVQASSVVDMQPNWLAAKTSAR